MRMSRKSSTKMKTRNHRWGNNSKMKKLRKMIAVGGLKLAQSQISALSGMNGYNYGNKPVQAVAPGISNCSNLITINSGTISET